jgi:hypothetical protein
MSRVRDWQSIYVRPSGESMTVTHSSRDLAAASIADALIMLAKLSWQCGQDKHVPALLRAAEGFVAAEDDDSYMYMTPQGGTWVLVRV